MQDLLSEINSTSAALIAGLVTSVHCAGMCGPLACYLSPKPEDRDSFVGVTAVYHTGRIFSYSLLGGLAGGLGLLSLSWLDRYENSLLHLLPWAMVLFFVIIALRLDKALFRPAMTSRTIGKALQKVRSLPSFLSAGGVGLITPALPCAPLYAMLSLALMTQSPARGAEFLFAFSLGTVPLLWLVQLGWSRSSGWFTPKILDRAQRIIALLAAILITLRLLIVGNDGNLPFCGS